MSIIIQIPNLEKHQKSFKKEKYQNISIKILFIHRINRILK